MSERILSEELIGQIGEVFTAQLKHPVELLYFFSRIDCQTCDDTPQLLQEIAAISDKIQLSSHDLTEPSPVAEKFGVELTPGLVILPADAPAGSEYALRFSGIPSGYEFSSLIQAIILVSRRDSGLKQEIRTQLKTIQQPVHLQVFVTPT